MSVSTLSKDEASSGPEFFPQIIREFEDDDEPMVYVAARNQ